MAIINNKIEVITTDAIASIHNRPATHHYFDAYMHDHKNNLLICYTKKGDKQNFTEDKDENGTVIGVSVAGTEPVYNEGYIFNLDDVERWEEI